MCKKFSYTFLILFFIVQHSPACQCPNTTLSLQECNKYEIIFKGKIISVRDCNNNFGEAVFEVEELYKGNATKQFKVLFECGGSCDMKFLAGEEWVIYSKYKQLKNAMMDWCSRSRKYFKNEKLDFYTVNYGNDYFTELKFLRENLGLHRVVVEKVQASENRNIRPSSTQMVITLLVSLVVMILFFWLFNKYFKF